MQREIKNKNNKSNKLKKDKLNKDKEEEKANETKQARRNIPGLFLAKRANHNRRRKQNVLSCPDIGDCDEKLRHVDDTPIKKNNSGNDRTKRKMVSTKKNKMISLCSLTKECRDHQRYLEKRKSSNKTLDKYLVNKDDFWQANQETTKGGQTRYNFLRRNSIIF